jgi:hypothetical protein
MRAIRMSVVIRMGIDMHRRMPATGYPNAARPVTRHPGITDSGTRRSHHGDRRGSDSTGSDHDRGQHRGCGGSDNDHGDGRKGNTDRKAEANSGVSRQADRTDEGGSEKQFRFHDIYSFVFLKAITAFIDLYGAMEGILQRK